MTILTLVCTTIGYGSAFAVIVWYVWLSVVLAREARLVPVMLEEKPRRKRAIAVAGYVRYA